MRAPSIPKAQARAILVEIDGQRHRQSVLSTTTEAARKDEDVKEDFSILGNDLATTYGDDLKKSMKDQPIQAFDPSRNVISEYSFKALKPTEQALDDIQIGRWYGRHICGGGRFYYGQQNLRLTLLK